MLDNFGNLILNIPFSPNKMINKVNTVITIRGFECIIKYQESFA